MTLLVINKVALLAQSLDMYGEGLHTILVPETLHIFFEDHWSSLRGRTKWKICRLLWRVAWEFYGLNLRWLLVGGRRLRAAGPQKVRLIDPTLPARLRERALEMMTQVREPQVLSLRDAVKLRDASFLAIQADLAARISETGLMDLPQIFFTGEDVLVHTLREHSKVRKDGRDSLNAVAALVTKAYLRLGRPVLLAIGNDVAKEALWITSHGLKAEATTMAAALRRRTRDMFEGGVASGDVRRASVSQPNQMPAEQWQQLRQVYNSTTAMIVYAKRDRAEAVELNARLSTLRAEDVPTFSAVAPKRTKQRAPRRATVLS